MIKLENNNESLIFFTSAFPYANSESFIETEIKFLSKNFNTIQILSHNIDDQFLRPVPENVKVKRIRYNLNRFEKFLSTFQLFSKTFWSEYYVIKYKYKKKISFGILKTMLISLYNAKRLSLIYNDYIINLRSVNVTCYSYWSNDSAIALALIKKSKQKIKCIARVHGWDVFFEPSKYNYLPYRNLISNRLNAIYSISNKAIDFVKNDLKIENYSNYKLSRLGVSKQDLKFDDNDKILIVSCSAVIPLKRVILIAEVMSKLKFKNVSWTHIGAGEGFVELEKYCNKNIKITYSLLGNISNKEVIKYYKQNNPSLFINLSSTEGVPVSIMEALSFGIPVIATNVGGVNEIVNNKNGYLLNKNLNVNDVVEIIYNHSKLTINERNFKRKIAYNFWENHYNSYKNYEDFINLISES